MTIAEFDRLPDRKKKELLFNCCGSTAWAKGMLEVFPVNDLVDLLEYAEEKWYDCNSADWLEAFKYHSKTDDEHAPVNFNDQITIKEAAGAKKGKKSVLAELEQARKEYKATFGYVFIAYITGKTAASLLKMLKERLQNDPEDELSVTAAEQFKITRQRIKRLFA